MGVITGALLLALALSRFLQMPARPLNLARLGMDATLPVSSGLLIGCIIVGMAVSGVMSLVYSHPRARQEPIDASYMYTIVPALWSLALALALPQVENPVLWGIALLGGGLVFALLLFLEYGAVARSQTRSFAWQWTFMVCVHLTAVTILVVVHAQHLGGLATGLLAGLTMFLLATRYFWSNAGNPADALIYGSMTAILMGQMAWALNAWPLSSLRAGLLLFVLFYVLVGLIQQQRLRQFSARIGLEYGGVALVAVLLILLLGSW